MRFLADESCDFDVVRALRDHGHDVLAVTEESPGMADALVVERAVRDIRVVITEDKDFGELVFAAFARDLWRGAREMAGQRSREPPRRGAAACA